MKKNKKEMLTSGKATESAKPAVKQQHSSLSDHRKSIEAKKKMLSCGCPKGECTCK